MSQPERSRTITWEDPMIGAKLAPTMTGLEYFQTITKGEIPPPPIMLLMGIELSEVEEGRVVFAVEPAEYHYNPIGVAHGGLACTLLDSAMGCAVHSTLPIGVRYTSLEVKVNFLRSLTVQTGKVFCEGKVIYVGGRVATAEARIYDAEGKIYGHGTTTCMIFRP